MKIDFSNMRFSQKKMTVGIELGDSWLKVVTAEIKDSSANVRSIIAREIKGKTDEEIAQELSDVLRAVKPAGASFYAAISRAFATVRYLNLPSTNESELSDMVAFQAQKLLPYPGDEMILDYVPLGADEKGYSRLMLMIVRRPVIERYLNILGRAGVSVEKLTLTPEAAGLSLPAKMIEESKTGQGAVAFINIDHLLTDINVFAGTKLVYTRSVSIGAAHKNRENIRQKFIDEISGSFSVYEKESIGPKLGKLVLSESVLVGRALIEKLQKILSVPVETFDPLGELSGDVLKDIEPIRKVVSFAVPLGLVSAPGRISLNLLPGAVKTSLSARRLRQKLMLSGYMLVPLVILLSLIAAKELYDRNAYLSRVDERIRKIQPAVSEVRQLKKKLYIVREEIGSTGVLDILRELYRVTPDNVYLGQFSYEKGDSMVVQGAAPDLTAVTNFVEALKRSKYFKNAKIKYATKKKVRYGAERMDFEIECPLS